MDQKFVKFEDALKKLDITPERLNQLREDGGRAGVSRRRELEIPRR